MNIYAITLFLLFGVGLFGHELGGWHYCWIFVGATLAVVCLFTLLMRTLGGKD